jgi:pimeloyl-ACP methyl ester carboxylesterase
MSISFSRISGSQVAALAATAVGAGLALMNRANADKAERRNTIGGAFVDVGGVKLHYLSKGEGSPIVLLHGNGSMIQDWLISGLFDRLAKTHRVIAFDRTGFGYSDRPRSTIWTPEAQAELFAAAFKQLGLETPVVVGHSFGTLVTLALALNHPESVSRIVLLGGYYYPTARIDAVLGSGPAIPFVGDIMRYTVSPVVGKLMEPAANKKLFEPAEVPQAWKDDYPVDLALRPSQIRAVAAEAALMVPAAVRLSRRYNELSLPTTIVAGEGAQIVDPAEQSQRLHRELPASELLMEPLAGHMVHHSACGAVHEAIVSS